MSVYKPHRPLSLTLLALVVLFIAIANLWRSAQAIVQWRFIAEWLPFSPLYLVFGGLLWGVAAMAVYLGLWIGWRWVQWGMPLFFGLYSLYFWLDRLLLSPLKGGANWRFCVAANFLLAMYTLWVLLLPKVRLYLGA